MRLVGGLFQTLAAATCLLIACSSEDKPVPERETSCEPGEQVACVCEDQDDAEGTAECGDDGEPDECACAEPDPEPEPKPVGKDTKDAGAKPPAQPDRTPDSGASAPVTDAGKQPASGTPDAGGMSPPTPQQPSSPPGAANPAMAGPYPTTTEQNVGPGMAFTLVRPRELGANGVKHPLITWGNGTGATPTAYTSLLNRLASHGFVVIASNSTNTGMATEMLQGVDWILEQNKASGSMLFGKIDETQIGATGHSQGGFGTCQSARDPRIKTIAPIQGFRAPASSYAGSIFAIAGGMDTIVSPMGISSGFDRLSKGPAMYGELKAATHTDWLGGRNASGTATNEAVVAWMRVQLMADQALRSRFYGASCGYCSDPAWTVKQKGMD